MKTIFVQTLILVFIASSCGDAETRLNNKIEGSYKLVFISKNNTEYTEYWNTYYNLNFHFYKPDPDSYVFQLDGSIKKAGIWYNYSFASPYSAYYDGDEQYIKFSAGLPAYEYDSLYPELLFYPIIIDSGIQISNYRIIKIDKDGMRLEYIDQDDKYLITLND